MTLRAIIIGFAVAGIVAAASPATAQTFQTWQCADGSQFGAVFIKYDKRAHVQIDGKALALSRRLGMSGPRYVGGGVAVTFTKSGATLKHGKRPATACNLI